MLNTNVGYFIFQSFECTASEKILRDLRGLKWPYSNSLELELRLKVAVKFYVPKRFYSNYVDVRLELIIRVRTEHNR